MGKKFKLENFYLKISKFFKKYKTQEILNILLVEGTMEH